MKVFFSSLVSAAFLGEDMGTYAQVGETKIPITGITKVIEAVHSPDSPVGTVGVGFAISNGKLEYVGYVGEVVSVEDMADSLDVTPDRLFIPANSVMFKTKNNRHWFVSLFVPLNQQQ